MTARSVPEWVGRRPESMPTDKVKFRIGDRHGNRCACGCGHVFDYDTDQIDCDHILALKDGGENRESNLQLLLRQHHVTKTNAEATARAAAERHKAKAFRHERKKSRGFPQAEPQHTATRAIVRKSDLPEESRPYRSQE